MKIKIVKEVELLISSLDSHSVAKVLRVIELLESFGNKLGMPHSRKIKNGLSELRIRGQREVRIFYLIKNNEIIMLFGYVKKTQKIPRLILKKIDKFKFDTI